MTSIRLHPPCLIHAYRCADGPFRQQRLPAWQPVLTPRTVLPAFFIFGILFLPIGGLLYWNSGKVGMNAAFIVVMYLYIMIKVDELMINYSHCGQYSTPVYLAPSLYDFQFSKDLNISEMQPPAYHYENTTEFQGQNLQNPNNLTVQRCILDFTVPTTMSGPIYMYYRLTNFYQNHRLYIKNFDQNQLLGERVGQSTLNENCGPLAYMNNSVIYPCGIVANSMFNGKFYEGLLK